MSTVSTASATAPIRFRQSLAKVLIEKSPRHAWHAYQRGEDEDPTVAKNRGQLVDQMLFGVVSKPVVLVHANDFRTNAAKAAKASALAEGGIPILAKKYEELKDIVAALMVDLEAQGVDLSVGKAQVDVEWDSVTNAGIKVPCKGKLDHLTLEGDPKSPYAAIIRDLKTTVDASPEGVAKSMVKYGAHIQREAYVEAINTLYPSVEGRVQFQFIYAEVNGITAVTLAEPAGSMRALGAQQWRRAVATWEKCLRAREWPAYTRPGEVLQIEAKPWQLNEEIEVSMEEEKGGE